MPPVQWTERYEQLREQALVQGQDAHGWGVTLFLRCGLVAWLRAWPQASSPTPQEEHAARETPKERRRLSADLRDEVISVWVNMVLQKQEELSHER